MKGAKDPEFFLYITLNYLFASNWTVTETTGDAMIIFDSSVLFCFFIQLHYQFSLYNGYRHTNTMTTMNTARAAWSTSHIHISAWTEVFVLSALVDIFHSSHLDLLWREKHRCYSLKSHNVATVSQHAQYHPLLCVVLKLLLYKSLRSYKTSVRLQGSMDAWLCKVQGDGAKNITTRFYLFKVLIHEWNIITSTLWLSDLLNGFCHISKAFVSWKWAVFQLEKNKWMLIRTLKLMLLNGIQPLFILFLL